MPRGQIHTIASITKYLKRAFDNDDLLQTICLKGEISNFKKHSRGHMYFTLKDEAAKIQAVMFAGNNRFLKFIPEDGMNIIACGSITVYEASGQYQLYVNEMEPDGIGNLYLAYEQLKERLEKAEYFAAHHKKALPKFPKNIGVVTSLTGAAVRDIISTIKRRFPMGRITLFPVLVQGVEAPASIAKAIKQANAQANVDVLIVGRGGGSIEELWAFNEEIVAESIFASEIPIISAVGHETDYTIADFVADRRAATPTAAAELAVPHWEELSEKISQWKIRLHRAVIAKVETEKKKLISLQKSYAFRYPKQLVQQKELELDRCFDRLIRQTTQLVASKATQLQQLERELQRNHVAGYLTKGKQQLEKMQARLKHEMTMRKSAKEMQFQQLLTKLQTLNPLSVMARGYSLAYDKNGQLIKSVAKVTVGDVITIKLTDGTISNQIIGLEKKRGGEK